MESWKNGRRDLFDQLTKVCDRIGQDLAVEIDDRNKVRIGEEELRLLRENSTRAETLAEQNAFLLEELDKWKEASSRVEDLEKENRRLAGELAQSLKQQQQISGTPQPRVQIGTNSKSATPGPSDLKSSAAGIEGDLSKTMVSKEQHQALIVKYNRMFEQHNAVEGVRKILVEEMRADKDRIKAWMKWEKIQNQDTKKKDEKIYKLEEEIQRLRAQSNGERGASVVPIVRKGDGGAADEFDGEVTRAVQVPMSSPIKGHEVTATMIESETAGQDLNILDPFDHRYFPAPEELGLPPHRLAADMHVDDTDFEAIEAQHTSSIEGSDPISPSKATRQEQAPMEKSIAQRSSSPAIVEVRCIKKRKTLHNSQKIKTEVKVETISSSPIGLARLQYLDSSGSLDLDDIGEKVDTPRKQRRVVEVTPHNSRSTSLSPLAAKLRGHRQSQGNSNTAVEEAGNGSQETLVRRTNSILQSRSTNRQILPRTSEDKAPKKRRIASDEAVGELVEDGEIEAAAAKSRRLNSNANDRLVALLAKPSPPKQVLSPLLARAGRQEPGPMKTPVASGLAREVRHNFEEEYEEIINFRTAKFEGYFPSSVRRRGPQSADSSRSSSKGSYVDSDQPILPSSRTSLRESAGSSRPTSKGTSRGSEEPLRPTSKGSSRVSMQISPVQNNCLPPKRLLPADFAKASLRTPAANFRLAAPQTAEARTPATSISRRTQNGTTSRDEINTDQIPLRERPLSKLKRTDFIINPNWNQGYSYAFNEVVRGRTARQECLQGCTKPECCGSKFRTLVEMERETRGPPTLSQEEADEMLLDEYMGDNAYRVRSMSKEQREELIIEAMTRDMANKYGRHRHAYERRISPPGFWRADFPSTQEEREDLAEAIEMEKHAVRKGTRRL